jgi:toxin ParE1/3/4
LSDASKIPMAIKLLFTSETHADIDEAYQWYNKRRVGLGDEFLLEVADTIQRITSRPELCPLVDDSYRQALVKRFPYSIVYEYDRDYVTIYAVAHTARDQAAWRRRLP